MSHQHNGEGGFPLSRKFYVRTDVNLVGFTYVDRKKRCMSRVRKRKKLNAVQLFTFTRGSYIASFYARKASQIHVCTHVKFTPQWKSTLNHEQMIFNDLKKLTRVQREQ